MAESKPIKVAVIGLGRAGYSIHIRRMRDDQRFRVTAVSDRLGARLLEVQQELDCAAYPDYQALLANAGAEAVVVATYSSTHPEITCDILRSGRHAICEKPIADSVAAAESMLRAAQKSDGMLLIHHNTRFTPLTRHLLDVVQEQRLGEVFEIRYRNLSFTRRGDWQTLRKYAGGLLNNHGAHIIDVALQLLEAPVADIFCDLKLISDVGDAEDHVKLVLRAENGRVFDLEASTSCYFPEPMWTILGTHGTLVCDGEVSKMAWFDPAQLADLEPDESPPSDRRYETDDVIPWREEQVPAVGPDIGDFYDNVWAVLRADQSPVVTPEQALEVVRVTQAAKRRSKLYQ